MYSLATATLLVRCMELVGDHVWCGTEQGPVLVYDAYSRRAVKQIDHHAGSVNCIFVNEHGVWTGSGDFSVVQWTKQGFEIVRIFTGHSNAVRALLCFGNVSVWSGSDDHTIRVWDTQRGHCIQELDEHDSGYVCVCDCNCE
jgi:WD40 repeat protein